MGGQACDLAGADQLLLAITADTVIADKGCELAIARDDKEMLALNEAALQKQKGLQENLWVNLSHDGLRLV